MDGTTWPPTTTPPAAVAPPAAAVPKGIPKGAPPASMPAFVPPQMQAESVLSPNRVTVNIWKSFFINCGTQLDEPILLTPTIKAQLGLVLRTTYLLPVEKEQFIPYFLGILRCLQGMDPASFPQFYPIVLHYMNTAIALNFSSSCIYLFIQALPGNFYPAREQKVQFYTHLCQQKGSFIHFLIQMHIDKEGLDEEEERPCCDKTPQEFPFLAHVALSLLVNGVHPEFVEADYPLLAYFFAQSYPVCVSKGCEPVDLVLVLNTLAQRYQSNPAAVEVQDLLRLLLDIPLPPTLESTQFFQLLLAQTVDALDAELLEGHHIAHYLPLYCAALPEKLTPENIIDWLPFLTEGCHRNGVEFIRPYAHLHPLLKALVDHKEGLRFLQLVPLFNLFEKTPQFGRQLIFKSIIRFLQEGSTFSDVNEAQFTAAIQNASCQLDQDFFILVPLIAQCRFLLPPLSATLDNHLYYSHSINEQFSFIGKLAQYGFFTAATLQRPYQRFCNAREQIVWSTTVLEAGMGFIQILGWNSGEALGFFAAIDEMRNVVLPRDVAHRFTALLEKLDALRPLSV